MKYLLPAFALVAGILAAVAAIWAADPPPDINHVGPVAAPYGVPEGSLFGGTPAPSQVYICTVESHRRETPPDDFGESGVAHLKVVRCLTDSKRKTLTLSYWVVRRIPSGMRSGGLEAAWPDLDKLHKDALVLCAVDERNADQLPGKDGWTEDVAPLSGPDDPIIAQVERIIKLRDTQSIDELKRQCRQILDAHAGLMAMQAAVYVTFYRIAPKDPEAAFHLILLRLRSPENISGWELQWELTFIGKYLDKPASPIHNWQELANCVVPLLTAPPDPNEDLYQWDQCEPAVLHLLARVVHPKGEPAPTVWTLRAAAISGVLEAIRRSKPYEPFLDEKAPQVAADVKAIQQWLDGMPRSPTTKP